MVDVLPQIVCIDGGPAARKRSTGKKNSRGGGWNQRGGGIKSDGGKRKGKDGHRTSSLGFLKKSWSEEEVR